MNWFKKHLNWTLAITWLSFIVLVLPTAVADTPTPYLIMFTTWAVMVVGVSGWVLKQKSRSLWNLLWFLIAGIVIIFLENKASDRVLQEEAKCLKSREEQDG